MLLSETPYLADVKRMSGLVKFEEDDFDVIVAGWGPAGLGSKAVKKFPQIAEDV